MRLMRRRITGSAKIELIATGIIAAALLVPVAANADEAPGGTGAADPCAGAKTLAEADRLAENCLPGNAIARMDDSAATLGVGESASSDNVRLLANVPKQGAFATESGLNTDLAFQGDYAYAGNYNGFTVYDIRAPQRPRVVAQVVCPGAQNDVSVYDNLLILSTDSSRNDSSCSSTSQSATIKDSWEGIKVFDISNPAKPRYVAAVETACGSHTHTLAPSNNPADRTLYVYVSSYSPNASFPDCQPPLDSISVVSVPLDNPAASALTARPVLFPDGGNPAGNNSSETSGCHDVTAYPSKNLMAGACMGDGIIMDITNRLNPVVTSRVRDTENFAFWHSATFNNDATKVVFTDELGGGGAPTCNETVGPERGANGIYDLVGGQLQFRSYYKIPRVQANTENCVAHNGSLVPVPGRDIMVQAWYQGGWSMFDFTDSANPREIAWYDRGPIAEDRAVTGGNWSTYYYNGFVYSTEIQRGFDVFRVSDSVVNRARTVKFDELNPQSQPRYR